MLSSKDSNKTKSFTEEDIRRVPGVFLIHLVR